MTIALKAGGFLRGKVNPDELTARLVGRAILPRADRPGCSAAGPT